MLYKGQSIRDARRNFSKNKGQGLGLSDRERDSKTWQLYGTVGGSVGRRDKMHYKKRKIALQVSHLLFFTKQSANIILYNIKCKGQVVKTSRKIRDK